MHRPTLAALTALSVAVVALAGCARSSALTAKEQAAFRTALAEIDESDQRFRVPMTWGTTDPEEIERLNALSSDEQLAEMSRRRREGVSLPPDVQASYEQKQIEIDIANTQRLLTLVEAYGWPTTERLDGPFEDPTAVLIHMRMEDVEHALPILRREVDAGRMPPAKYAAIVDRKRQHDGRIQLYGMCLAFDPATRSIMPPLIEDIDTTNAARAAIGLEPLTEYTLVGADDADDAK